jgi:hypothetical protein
MLPGGSSSGANIDVSPTPVLSKLLLVLPGCERGALEACACALADRVAHSTVSTSTERPGRRPEESRIAYEWLEIADSKADPTCGFRVTAGHDAFTVLRPGASRLTTESGPRDAHGNESTRKQTAATGPGSTIPANLL